MARRTSTANRYAEAVFEVARDHDSADLWLRELGEIEHVLSDELASRVLLNPVVPRERKRAILLEALPNLSEPVQRFLDLLLRRDRLQLVPQIAERLRELIAEARGIERARVVTAVPLGERERQLLAQRLAAFAGKRVILEEEVDPSLIGGVVAQIGDQVLDGSVRGRLEQLRRVLAGT